MITHSQVLASFTGAPVLRSIGVAAAPPPAQRKMTDDANVQPPFTALYTEAPATFHGGLIKP
ncbi:hypothetical protein C8F01DRAFT_1249520 [Mycena amicta]|nr:hypothetical protein C8F01DRAFT_1249520 [Mycena amicta]